MTDFTIKEASALLGVSDETVRRWADAGRIHLTKGANGRQQIEGTELAALLVAQREESELAEAFPLHKASARNRFVGVVTQIVKDEVMAQVDVQAGPFRVVSLMSREAVDDLGLKPGDLAVASAKATTVTVEVP